MNSYGNRGFTYIKLHLCRTIGKVMLLLLLARMNAKIRGGLDEIYECEKIYSIVAEKLENVSLILNASFCNSSDKNTITLI